MFYSRYVYAAFFLCSMLVFAACSGPSTTSQTRPGVFASTDDDNVARKESSQYSVPPKDLTVPDEAPAAAARKAPKAKLALPSAQPEQVARKEAPAVVAAAPAAAPTPAL